MNTRRYAPVRMWDEGGAPREDWIHRNDDLPSVEGAVSRGIWETGMPVAPGAVSSEDGSMGGDGCVRQVCAARPLLALLGGLER